MKSSDMNFTHKAFDAGVSDPRDYRDCVIHDWNLLPEYQKHLVVYVIAETTPADLFFHLKDGELFIKEKPYAVTWIDSPATARVSEILLVSLRFCKYMNKGYALVKTLRGHGQFKQLEY